MSSGALRAIRKRMIEVACKAQDGHLPSSLSVLEILYTLYDSVLGDEDQCILSKGHASLAFYAVQEHFGRLPTNYLDNFCLPGGPSGHPERGIGSIATTGSLGHGAAMSPGLAYALKLSGSSAKVFCLLGDQEMNEGVCFESALIASTHKLDNLVWVVDDNDSSNRSLPMGSIAQKMQAFGWQADWVSGHSIPALKESFKKHYPNQPYCIVAKTIKGRGVQLMEDEPNEWHHKPVAKVLADKMIADLA
jgi:transketolase